MAPIKTNNPVASYFDFFSKTGKDAVSPVPPPLSPLSGSGGTKTTSGDYTIHTFTSPGTFSVASGEANISYLVIGGGGSGGSLGGGGGAGLVKYKSAEPLTPGTYPVTVGPGGAEKAAHPSPPNYGNSGGDSTFALSTPVVATGGGGGGGEGQPGRAGGSAGGDGNNAPTTSVDALGASGHPGSADVESPPAGWGNNGGRVADHPDGYSGGGGGGAGSVGGNASQSARGTAGNGQPFPTFSVPAYMPAPDPYRPGINPLPGTFYGGGGGAGSYPPFLPQNMPSNATAGGGGIGGPPSGAGNGTAGVNGLGGGGGGATGLADGPAGGIGGNGIVVIRYSV